MCIRDSVIVVCFGNERNVTVEVRVGKIIFFFPLVCYTYLVQYQINRSCVQ